MQKKAVIDLGTNTFHLLIVKMKNETEFEEIFRKRIYVKLAEEGIETIGENAINRAFEAMQLFSKKLKEFDCENVTTYATAALRTASNGADFIQKVKTETDIQIELIDGLKEAELIFNGVRKAVAFDIDYQLVMDIGGGSTEFIIGNENGAVWSESFVAGVGVLHQKFHKTEPIAKSEIEAVENYLESILPPLFEAVIKYNPTTLTGSAGAFETMSDLIPCVRMSERFAIYKPEHFPAFRDQVVNANLKERFAIKGMPEMRAEQMPVALILIDFILKRTNIRQIFYSAYALKEGMIFQ